MKAKRTLAGALALAMLASTAVSVPAYAADSAITLEAAKVTAEAGGEFSVDISLKDIPSTKVNVLDFAITFESDVLTVTDVAIGASANIDTSGDTTTSDAPAFDTEIRDSEVDVLWTTGLDSDSWIADDGVILTISGTVKDGVEDGTVTPIGFAAADRSVKPDSADKNADLLIGAIFGSDVSEYTVTAVEGSVTIGEKGDVTTEPVSTTEAPSTTTEGAGETGTAAVTTEGKDSETEAPTTTNGGGQDLDGVLYGDVNMDGRVDITDAVLLNKLAAGAAAFTSDLQRENANCSQDSNEVNVADATVLLQFLVSVIKTLPYTPAQ